MKTCSIYGFIAALAGAFLALVLYFLGYHTDPAKMAAAQWIGSGGGTLIIIVCMVVGVRARRAEAPAPEPFGYGRALGAGVQVALVWSILSAVFNFAYVAFINPGFAELMVQYKMDQLQAKGISGADLDRAEKYTRMLLNPVPAAISTLIYLFILGFIIALIVAIFLKRPAPAQPRSI